LHDVLHASGLLLLLLLFSASNALAPFFTPSVSQSIRETALGPSL